MTKKKTAAAVAPAPATMPPLTAPAQFEEALGLVVWKMRHHLPALVITITAADRQGLADALAYNEQTLKVNIEERKGVTLVHLTDAKSGDQIVATENNEADLDRAQAAANLRQIRQNAPVLASQLKHDLAQGNMSSSTIEDACAALVALARVPL